MPPEFKGHPHKLKTWNTDVNMLLLISLSVLNTNGKFQLQATKTLVWVALAIWLLDISLQQWYDTSFNDSSSSTYDLQK